MQHLEVTGIHLPNPPALPLRPRTPLQPLHPPTQTARRQCTTDLPPEPMRTPPRQPRLRIPNWKLLRLSWRPAPPKQEAAPCLWLLRRVEIPYALGVTSPWTTTPIPPRRCTMWTSVTDQIPPYHSRWPITSHSTSPMTRHQVRQQAPHLTSHTLWPETQYSKMHGYVVEDPQQKQLRLQHNT
jgi:hypothetical protein